MSSWELTNITAHLVLPPGALIVMGLIGLALVRSRMRFGAALVLVALVSLYLLSIPAVSQPVLQWFEAPYADPARDARAGAIVVLGGGSYHRAPEYGGDTVSRYTLERLRYAAYLQKRTGKPILVTGGNPAGGDTSEGEQMKNALRDFGASVRWIESDSHNTFENAKLSGETLGKAGVQRVYLVTHAWHIPRSRLAFERAGLEVVPAPMGYTTRLRVRPLDFVPNANALTQSYIFFHEVVGIAWYRLRYGLGT